MPLATGRTKKETQFQSFEAFLLALRASHTIWITKTGKFKFDHDSTLIDRIEIGQLRKSLFSIWSRWSGNSSHSWRGKKKKKKSSLILTTLELTIFFMCCVSSTSPMSSAASEENWSFYDHDLGPMLSSVEKKLSRVVIKTSTGAF